MEQDLLQVGTSLDLAGDQILPTAKWGTSYILVENEARSTLDKAYITAGPVPATITYKPSPTAAAVSQPLAPYETFVINLVGSGALEVVSDAPVSAYHLSSLGDPNFGTGNQANEVAGAVVPPLGCTGSSVVGVRRSPPSEEYYVNLLAPAGTQNDFQVNGLPLNGSLFCSRSGQPRMGIREP